MQQPSNLPQQIRVTQLGGVNERVTPSGLKAGEFSYLEGLYPSQTGLLSRVPGKTLLSTVAGSAGILSMCQTFNSNGDIVVQTESGILAYTLDELFNRQTVPNLTPGTTPGSNVEEEGMSMALMYQEEANGQAGGSLRGWLSGTDNVSTANAFDIPSGRRLTSNPVNQSSTLVSFTASTGGAGASSTAGQFVLAPATYRIHAWFVFGSSSAALGVNVALYNITTSGIQLDAFTGGTGSTTPQPIIGSAVQIATTTNYNFLVEMEGRFTVSSSNNTFQFVQAVSTSSTVARDKNLCGFPTLITASIVAGAAPLERYAMVKILKEP